MDYFLPATSCCAYEFIHPSLALLDLTVHDRNNENVNVPFCGYGIKAVEL